MATRAPRQFRDCFYDVLTGSATASPGAITTGTTYTGTSITVPGVVVGDYVLGVQYSLAQGAVHVFGEVTAADTVQLRISNTTAGSITPTASTVYTAIVLKVNTLLNT
jgi:hypothetical protein